MKDFFNVESGHPHQQRLEEKRRAFAYVLILLILISVFSVVIYFFNHSRNLEIRADIQFAELNEMENAIHNEMRFVINPLLIFHKSVYARKILEAVDEDKRDVFNDIFLSIISERIVYNQIRLINSAGREIVRVDRQISGEYYVVPQESLQDKSNRYYFKETIATPNNSIYLSPFDLNVEHGKIEVPHKPMIRLGKKIQGKDGKDVGIMILNVMGQHLLNTIETLNIHKNDQVVLLNEDGYYLLADKKEKAFGFMFPEKQDIGFFNDHPAIWEKIKDGITEIHTAAGSFYILKVDPVAPQFYQSTKKKWYLVMHVPRSEINKGDESLINTLIINMLMISPILGVLGWSLGVYQVRNNWYKRKLLESATRDSLTDLYNRRVIIDLLNQSIGLSRRTKGALTILFIDINDLKFVNDKFGHKAGDRMIIAAAEAISSSVRSSDLVARLGGDEFLVILPDCDDAAAHVIMQRGLEKFAEQGERQINSAWSMSYGCAMLLSGENADDLIGRADHLMYKNKAQIKQKTKGSYTTYT